VTRTSMWAAPYTWVSVGAIALVFLAALQALAVTTVMPVVSDDLGGADLYAVAFSATLAASVVGMVAAGAWCDRDGPLRPLVACVALFVLGLTVAGLAPTMAVVVVGRLVQGLGAGGITVALYVVVARAYPAALHVRVFAAFSAAWVVPSLVGPFVAGAVAQYLHWRWVFLGVAVLAVAALGVLVPRLPDLRRIPAVGPDRARTLRRVATSLVVAVALLALGLAASAGPFVAGVSVAALLAVTLAVRPLLPPGTLRAARALPSVVLLRGVLAAAFFSAEVYVPLYFVEVHRFTPVWAGLALTLAAVTWALGSTIQGGVGAGWADRSVATAGAGVLVFSLGLVVAVVAFALPAAVLIVAWSAGGWGMGLVYPRLSALTLAYSTPEDQGAHSAALSISDAVGASAAIAILGLAFTAAGGTTGGAAAAFVVAFALAVAIALLAFVPAARVGRAG
jgi:MFS family permease